MSKVITALILLASIAVTSAQSFYTAVIEVTNVTQTGNALTNNGVARIFTNAQSATTILTNLSSAAAASTNIWAQISLNRYVRQNVTPKTNATSVTLYSASPILIGILGTWGYVTYFTNAGVDGYSPRLPFSTLPLADSTNQATDITTGLKYSTHLAETNSQWLGNFLSLGVPFGGIIQTSTTEKVFYKLQGTNSGTLYGGGYANATGFTNVDAQRINFKHFSHRDAAENLGGGQLIFYDHSTNAISAIRAGTNGAPGLYDAGGGVLWNNDHYAVALNITNAAALLNVGSAIEQFPLLDPQPLVGHSTNRWTITNWFVGLQYFPSGFNATAPTITGGMNIGGSYTNSTSDGLSSSNNVFGGTNQWSGDIAFVNRPVTSLANGNNAGIVLGTNVTVHLSGASGAHTNCGFAATRADDFKMLRFANPGGMCVIANESGVEPVPQNRMVTGTGGELVSTNQPAWLWLKRNGTTERWEVQHFR